MGSIRNNGSMPKTMKAKRRRNTTDPQDSTDRSNVQILDEQPEVLPETLPPSEDVLNTEKETSAAPKAARSFVLPGIVMIFTIAIGVLVVANTDWFRRGPVQNPSIRPVPARYSSERAFKYLKALCDFGPRPSGSEAMTKQQEALKEFFTKAGATVTMQAFQIRHPENGSDVTMSNLIASFHPQAPKRFLICAHYDTRTWAWTW